MARLRIRRRWRLTLLATALAATAVTSSAGAAPPSTPDGCAMPECYAALAFNPQTGFFAVVKNFPTEQAARRTALGTCGNQGGRDRECVGPRAIGGERCLAAAMRVEDGAILEHAAAIRADARAALRSADRKLDGPGEQHHRIAVVCNG